MVPLAVVQRARELLAQGVRFNEIARQLPISRWSVQALAKGKTMRADRLGESGPADDGFSPYFERCRGCGGWCRFPSGSRVCLKCLVEPIRAAQSRQRIRRHIVTRRSATAKP